MALFCSITSLTWFPDSQCLRCTWWGEPRGPDPSAHRRWSSLILAYSSPPLWPAAQEPETLPALEMTEKGLISSGDETQTKFFQTFFFFPHTLVPDDFSILVPFDSLFMRWEHRIGLFGLLEEAAFSAPFCLHHQVVVFRLHCNGLVQIVVDVALVAWVHIHPTETWNVSIGSCALSLLTIQYYF